MGEQNHAEFKGSIAGQSFALSTKDIIPVLLLLAGMVGGYLIWLQVDKRLETMQAHHLRLFDMLEVQDRRASAHMTMIRQWFHLHDLNQGREPGERWPLEIDPTLVPPKPPPP